MAKKGKIVIECLERKLNYSKLADAVCEVLGQVAKFKVELVFQDEDGMQYLNKSTRGVDSVTDVLSYPSFGGIRGEILTPEKCATALEGRYIFMGSIVLCDQKIQAQALEYGHSEEEEREYLILHGLLHFFDYDHMTDDDKKEMRALEKKVISMLREVEER